LTAYKPLLTRPSIFDDNAGNVDTMALATLDLYSLEGYLNMKTKENNQYSTKEK